MTKQPETFKQWRKRTAPPPRAPWSRRKRLAVAGVVLLLGLVFAVPGNDHRAGAVLFVLFWTLAIALANDELPTWLDMLILIPLGVLAIVFYQPERADWITFACIAAGAISMEIFTRLRARRQ